MQFTFHYHDETVPLEPRRLRGSESLGAPHRFELEMFAPEPLAPAQLLGSSCALVLTVERPGGELQQRHWHGFIEQVAAIATAHGRPGRTYRLSMRAAHAALDRNRRRRVWQELPAADIITQLLERAGLPAPKQQLYGEPSKYAYLTQLDESDGRLLRRLLEQGGIWLRCEAGDGEDQLVLCDSVESAPDGGELVLVDAAGLRADAACAWALEIERRRAPGKLAVRDYNADKPAHAPPRAGFGRQRTRS